MAKVTINMATLESKKHEVNAIKSGIKIYESGKVEFEEKEGEFWFAAEDKSGRRGGIMAFSKDGSDLEHYHCNCRVGMNGGLCKHVVAAVLAIQGGISDSKIMLGKTATAETVVGKSK